MSVSRPKNTAIVLVAAGRGERAGQGMEGPKQYRRIGGEAVIARTLRAFLRRETCGPIIVALHPEDERLFADAVRHLDSRRIHTVHGGASRQASVHAALQALTEWNPQFVMIHDGVRPFIDDALLDRIAEALLADHGVIPAMAVADTLKRASADGLVLGTQPRDGLYSAQTPQAFPYAPILQAHTLAAEERPHDFTDDAMLAEWAGIPVRLVEGSPDNVKLTWAKDLDMAEMRLAGNGVFPDLRTGTGYDVHAFGPGDGVTLCGVKIPHGRSLTGHSDADVGLHALTDALLATCGEGDIGTHFPPSDPQWRGAASSIFLARAAELVRERGGRIANVDVTLIAEQPRIGPHRAAMVERMADILALDPGRISVKATTNERLGFLGREEGIAAIATASVIYPGSVPP